MLLAALREKVGHALYLEQMTHEFVERRARGRLSRDARQLRWFYLCKAKPVTNYVEKGRSQLRTNSIFLVACARDR